MMLLEVCTYMPHTMLPVMLFPKTTELMEPSPMPCLLSVTVFPEMTFDHPVETMADELPPTTLLLEMVSDVPPTK